MIIKLLKFIGITRLLILLRLFCDYFTRLHTHNQRTLKVFKSIIGKNYTTYSLTFFVHALFSSPSARLLFFIFYYALFVTMLYFLLCFTWFYALLDCSLLDCSLLDCSLLGFMYTLCSLHNLFTLCSYIKST